MPGITPIPSLSNERKMCNFCIWKLRKMVNYNCIKFKIYTRGRWYAQWLCGIDFRYCIVNNFVLLIQRTYQCYKFLCLIFFLKKVCWHSPFDKCLVTCNNENSLAKQYFNPRLKFIIFTLSLIQVKKLKELRSIRVFIVYRIFLKSNKKT